MSVPTGDRADAAVAVLHLVWAPLGSAPLRDFLSSYRRHEAGAEHELVIALNGIDRDDAAGTEAILRELAGVECRLIDLNGSMQDLLAYRRAVEQIEHDRICVLNSHSRILQDGWLDLLDTALSEPATEIVGATGSWASFSSFARFHLRLPSPYSGVLGSRSKALELFAEIEYERTGAPAPRGLRASINTLRALAAMALRFPSFPAAHLRTNSFMARRDLLLKLLPQRVPSKNAAYRLESGRSSITHQVLDAGGRVLVVDRAGSTFAPPDWSESETFWQGEQAGLLISDNQTDLYRNAGTARRQLLASYAWGDRARPL